MMLIAVLFAGPLAFCQTTAQTPPIGDCNDQYNYTPGLKVQSRKKQDLEACKGIVGESFCISEKEKRFLEQCRKNAKVVPPSVPVEAKPLEPDPNERPLEDQDHSEPEEDAEGFRDL